MTIEWPVKFRKDHEMTKQDFEDIVVGAFEGGCNYWLDTVGNTFQHGHIAWEGRNPEEPKSIFIANTLLDNKEIYIKNNDESKIFTLTLEKMIEGIKRNIRRTSSDFDQYDAIDYDCIIQYALYNEVVYG